MLHIDNSQLAQLQLLGAGVPIAMPPLATWSGAMLEQLQQVQLGSTGNLHLTSHLGAVPLMPPHAQLLQLPVYASAVHSHGNILNAYSVQGRAHFSEQQLLQGQLVVASAEQLEELLLARCATDAQPAMAMDMPHVPLRSACMPRSALCSSQFKLEEHRCGYVVVEHMQHPNHAVLQVVVNISSAKCTAVDNIAVHTVHSTRVHTYAENVCIRMHTFSH